MFKRHLLEMACGFETHIPHHQRPKTSALDEIKYRPVQQFSKKVSNAFVYTSIGVRHKISSENGFREL